MNAEHNLPDFDFDDDLEDADEVFGIEISDIRVYVEAVVDVDFWTSRLNKQGLFSVDVREISQHEPANGKDMIIKSISEGRLPLSKKQLVCLDSDYDNFHGKNQVLYQSDFVFQTYSYAIENFYYHPATLDGFIQAESNISDLASLGLIENKVKEWSKKHYKEFCYWVLKKKVEDETPDLDSEEKVSRGKIADLSKNLNLENINVHQHDYDICPKELLHFTNCGLTLDTVHLYYRGHNWESAAFSKLVRPYLTKLRKIKCLQIKNDPSVIDKKSAIAEVFSEDLKIQEKVNSRDLSNIELVQRIEGDVRTFKMKFWP